MSTTIVVPEKPDVREMLRAANEAEQARREGKPVAPPAARSEPEAPAAPQLTRAQRRAANHLHEELGAERARREMLEAQLAAMQKPAAVVEPKPAPEVKPERKSYATDAEFYMALGEYTAGQKTAKEFEKRDQAASAQKRQEAFEAAAKAALAKGNEDFKVFGDDWKEVTEAMLEDKRMIFDSDSLFNNLMATSRFQSPVMFWAAKNPDEFAALIAIKNPEEQIQEFRYVEGLAKSLLDEYKKKADNSKKDEPVNGKPKTAAERDAEKPKPSSEVSPRGGTATDGTIPMMLEDGKTLNPAWKAAENARRGVRP